MGSVTVYGDGEVESIVKYMVYPKFVQKKN